MNDETKRPDEEQALPRLLTDADWVSYAGGAHPYDRAADSSAYPDDANPENLCYVCGFEPDDPRHGEEGPRWAAYFAGAGRHPRAAEFAATREPGR